MIQSFFLTLVGHFISASIFLNACAPVIGDRFDNLPAVDETASAQDDALATCLVRENAHPIKGVPQDYDPLMRAVGDARFVMLGEATHGTHEFYRERARITRRLIEEKGFDAVVLEADWTDAFRVNQYVLGGSKDRNAEQALAGFTRFPVWMWRNREFRDLVNEIRAINDSRASNVSKVGIYGMDVYGVEESMSELLDYLKRTDPQAADRARRRYGCLGAFRERLQEYGQAAAGNPKRSCQAQVTEQFREMEERYRAWLAQSNRERNDDLFSAYQNARVVMNGEAYWRESYRREFSTWNLRDQHMADTIHALAGYFDAIGNQTSKIVVWAHNTHQGDAAMTAMGEAGELNVGHLMRKAFDGKTVLVGFTTDRGEVMASSRWGEAGRVMKLRPALPGSYSRLFTDTGIPDFLLIFRGNEALTAEFERRRLERAVGVNYLPETERQSHYFEARMSRQFDAVIHLSVTRAVDPL